MGPSWLAPVGGPKFVGSSRWALGGWLKFVGSSWLARVGWPKLVGTSWSDDATLVDHLGPSAWKSLIAAVALLHASSLTTICKYQTCIYIYIYIYV